MSLRPSHIGLLLVIIIATSLLLIPERQSKPDESDYALPPALYPAFPEEDMSQTQVPLVTIQKAPVSREISQGSSFHFSLSIENNSDLPLEDLTVEERFNGDILEVTEAESGEILENLVTWHIPSLDPRSIWLATYDVTAKKSASPQDTQTTLHVRGEVLENMTSASRMKTSMLTIVAMPTAGVTLLRSRLQPAPSPL